MNNLFIKRLNHNVYDVFLDKGFDKWVRVRRNHYGVTAIRGIRVNRTVLRDIAHLIN